MLKSEISIRIIPVIPLTYPFAFEASNSKVQSPCKINKIGIKGHHIIWFV